MDYMDKYNLWLNSPYVDDKTKEELKKIKDKKQIEDMFYKDIQFGTGGLRGIIGPGTNRMNIYVVRRASQGLANHIKKLGGNVCLRGVVIAYDSRHKSREFAMEAASVFAGNGIKSYVFEDLRPTPELSYAVRKLSAIAGIVITASHNPPEYNGYKVYWEDGAQVSLDTANEILSEINKISDFAHVKYRNLDTAKNEGLFSVIGEEIDHMYIDDIQSLIINKDLIKNMGDKLTIIYTPLHGSGNKLVRRSLKTTGFKNVHIVKEQELPDPDFRTVKSPNPEDPKAFELAIKMAPDLKPDIILGTDPDSDRLGVCVPDGEGKYVTLTGNQIGALLMEYILSQLKEKGKLPSNGAVIKTIVTSELGRAIASHYGVKVIDTLTGFKYIGDKIKEFEQDSSYSFLFGYEESYGYLAGTFVRDKDAVIASTLACEMALYCKSKNTSIYDMLKSIYKKYGFYRDSLKSITLKGKQGSETISRLMGTLRKNAPRRIGIEDVVDVYDYEKGIGDLPKADVLQLITDKKSRISIRPSGTEPKVKIYYSVNGKTLEDVQKRLDSLIEEFSSTINKIIKQTAN
jgi:phosphoglucomutase